MYNLDVICYLNFLLEKRTKRIFFYNIKKRKIYKNLSITTSVPNKVKNIKKKKRHFFKFRYSTFHTRSRIHLLFCMIRQTIDVRKSTQHINPFFFLLHIIYST